MKVHLREEEVIRLLNKYIRNECSREEATTLLRWLKSPESQEGFERGCASGWEQAFSDISYPDPQRERQLRQEALLLLQKLDNRKKTSFFTVRARVVRQLGKIAVAACLLLGIGLFTYNWEEKREALIEIETPVFQEFVAKVGEIKEIRLKDGSTVILNSGSRLRVPDRFNRKERTVEIDGEGFFKVMPDPEKPFLVDAKDVRVKVTGTSFNVNAYDEDNDIAVTVATGKVLVGMEEQQMQLQLLPNEHLAIDRRGRNISKEVLKENNYMKWMDGYLYFDKLPLRQVIRMITRKYNQPIELTCEDCNCLISGSHDNKSLQSVLEAVCFAAGLKQRMENGKIILYE